MKETPAGLVVPEHLDVSDGRLRRPGKGGRTAFDFFAKENHNKPLTRGELINIVGMIEYGRRENKLWRRLYRWVRGWPPAADLAANAAMAHGRSLYEIRQQLEKAAEEQMAKEAAELNASRRAK